MADPVRFHANKAAGGTRGDANLPERIAAQIQSPIQVRASEALRSPRPPRSRDEDLAALFKASFASPPRGSKAKPVVVDAKAMPQPLTEKDEWSANVQRLTQALQPGEPRPVTIAGIKGEIVESDQATIVVRFPGLTRSDLAKLPANKLEVEGRINTFRLPFSQPALSGLKALNGPR